MNTTKSEIAARLCGKTTQVAAPKLTYLQVVMTVEVQCEPITGRDVIGVSTALIEQIKTSLIDKQIPKVKKISGVGGDTIYGWTDESKSEDGDEADTEIDL